VGEKSREPLAGLLEKLGVRFRDKSLLEIALLHRSYSLTHQIARDNERLEFLGDSVLNVCVSDILFRKFPEKKEGDLTKIRAKLVSRKSLNRWGKELEIENYILISDKMKRYMAERQTHIVENTMEAIIGAIYLDQGFGIACDFISKYMENQDFHSIVDFKSTLQEYSVKKFEQIPHYSTVMEQGPPHQKEFRVTVSIKGEICGEGAGPNKKTAQQNAAQQAYKKLIESGKEVFA
jgi:ribonuclease-3